MHFNREYLNPIRNDSVVKWARKMISIIFMLEYFEFDKKSFALISRLFIEVTQERQRRMVFSEMFPDRKMVTSAKL